MLIVFTKLTFILMQTHKEFTYEVWREETFYFLCRAALEEELDMQRVQAAMDRATVKELRLCLTNEHQSKSLKLFQLYVISKNNFIFLKMILILWLVNILSIFKLSMCCVVLYNVYQIFCNGYK